MAETLILNWIYNYLKILNQICGTTNKWVSVVPSQGDPLTTKCCFPSARMGIHSRARALDWQVSLKVTVKMYSSIKPISFKNNFKIKPIDYRPSMLIDLTAQRHSEIALRIMELIMVQVLQNWRCILIEVNAIDKVSNTRIIARKI